jgi:1,4-alpha-glucan branching enzyme
MGAEIAPYEEWAHESSLPWNLLHDDPARAAHARYLAQLVQLYRDRPSLWIQDESWEGFAWIDIADRDNSVISYVRRGAGEKTLVILNLTPVPREGYRIGVPDDCSYRVALRTDDAQWGGSGYDQTVTFPPEPSPFHGFPQSIVLTLPPLCALVLSPNE